MTTFNFNKFLSKIAKKGDVEHIDEQLRGERGGDLDAPDTLTEKQIDKDRKEAKETTTEEKLDKVRTGSNESLVEGMLNSSKSKLHQHRNDDASAGDINKLEEQRMANKKRQETEKYESASETGKKNRLSDYSTSKDDGLKLASWGWEFGKVSKVVPKGSPDAMHYCKDCGAAYDIKPSMTSSGQMCEKCGGINISEIAGTRKGVDASESTVTPIPLDASKPMPKLQSSQGKIVTAKYGLDWDFDDNNEAFDPSESYESIAHGIMEDDREPESLDPIEDNSIRGRTRKEIWNPAFDVKEEKDPSAEADASEDEEEEKGEDPNFKEATVAVSTATGTKMLTIEVDAINTEAYEDDLGAIDDNGKKRLMTDVLAFLVAEHPEMSGNISSSMLNTSRIQEGKVSYQLPV